MIEERKKICRIVNTDSVKIGNAILELDQLPTTIKIKKTEFSE
jgi:hypothetical protein